VRKRPDLVRNVGAKARTRVPRRKKKPGSHQGEKSGRAPWQIDKEGNSLGLRADVEAHVISLRWILAIADPKPRIRNTDEEPVFPPL